MTGADGSVAAGVRQILVQVTGRADLAGVSDEAELFSAGIGLDSLAGTLLLRQIHRRYGVDVAAEDLNLDALQTVGSLAAFVAARAR